VSVKLGVMGVEQEHPGDERVARTGRPLDPRDYSRRTLLALERTYLAWWRTGLATLTVALAAARVVPELADAGTQWPYTVAGVGFAIVGIFCVAVGEYRRQVVARAIRRGDYVDFSPIISMILTGSAILLGVALIVIVLLNP